MHRIIIKSILKYYYFSKMIQKIFSLCKMPIFCAYSSKIIPEQVENFSNFQRWENTRKRLKSYGEKRANFIFNESLEHFKITKHQFSDLKILDLGCGAGIVAEELARFGGKIHGTLYNKNMVLIQENHKYNLQKIML